MPTWPYYGASVARRVDMASIVGVINDAVVEAVKQTFFEEATDIIDYAKENTVPVDLGILKASGTVGDPQGDRREVSIEFGFGGDASAYSVYVHEDLNARHGEAIGKPAGQGAKYLERPVLERAAGLPEKIAARAREILASKGVR